MCPRIDRQFVRRLACDRRTSGAVRRPVIGLSAVTPYMPKISALIASYLTSYGLSKDGARWIACRPNLLLVVRVLSRLFRRLVLQMLIAAHEAGRLQFFGAYAALTDTKAFAAFLIPLRRSEWVVYSKKPFGGPEAVLAYLARYTHRVAISNRRLIAADAMGVTFKYKDYSRPVRSCARVGDASLPSPRCAAQRLCRSVRPGVLDRPRS
jgi:Putative transposase